MTDKEKALAYDIALQKAKEWKSGLAGNNNVETCIDDLFPQLKDTEDERIWRDMKETIAKECIEFPSSVIAAKADEWTKWLDRHKPEPEDDKIFWKPTKEQLEALENSLGDYNITVFEKRHELLKSLYDALITL